LPLDGRYLEKEAVQSIDEASEQLKKEAVEKDGPWESCKVQ